MKLGRQKIESKNNFSDLTLTNNQCLLPVELNGNEINFLFDTGATGSVLFDSTAVKDFSRQEFFYMGSNRGADRKKNKNKFLVASFKSAMFESENKALLFINPPESKCRNKKSYSGILGLDVFFRNKVSLMMNFTKNQIANVTENQIKEIIVKEDYTLVKSKADGSKIFVWLKINNIEYKFKLDTGFNGNIVIPYSKKFENLFKSQSRMVLDGSLYNTTTSLTSGKEFLYEQIPVVFANESLRGKITISNSIKAQNIGMGFIKGFDWIIDYNNNKVYVKRNQNKIEDTFNRKVTYYSRFTDKLRITTKEKSQTKYNLNDEIISVNGQKVTPENSCELQDLLNKTEDWNTLDLEVSSVKK